MPLSDAERSDVRRFCGYPVRGGGAGAAPFGPAGRTVHLELEHRCANLSDPELVIVRRYLSTLTVLELAVPRASENLDTAEAAVWTHNRHEVRDRLALFDEWRRRLCQFLGVPPGPALAGGGTALVV